MAEKPEGKKSDDGFSKPENNYLKLYSLKKELANGRRVIIAVAGLTLLNMLLIFYKVKIIFPFSLTSPTFAIALASSFEFKYSIPNLVPIAYILSIFLITVYIFLYYLSKKGSLAILISLILFSVDSVLFIVNAVMLKNTFIYAIFGLIFHAWILQSLIRLYIDSIELKKLTRNM